MQIVQAAVKTYPWAEKDRAKNICNRFQPEENEPIAELWFGTHHEGSAHIQSTGERLRDYLGSDMKCFFKLLAVGKPLSIQVHPDKENARLLHMSNPRHYPDANAKPEMAIAMSDKAYAFCGIRSMHDICMDVCTYFSDVFDAYVLEQLKGSSSDHNEKRIRDCFINVYEMPEHKYLSLRRRLHRKDSMFRYLDKAFPGDRGCAICVLFLNCILLNKYDAVCVNTNEIHCYISGNLFECMATSNNVIRVGLSPKYIDYSTFFKVANFSPSYPETCVIRYKNEPVFTYAFHPLPLIHITDTLLLPQAPLELPPTAGSYCTFLVILRGINVLVNDMSVQENHVYLLDAKHIRVRTNGNPVTCSVISISI